MIPVDKLSNDATTAQLCTRQSHEAAKANADTFAAATTFVGVWLDGMVLGTCLKCGSSIAFDPNGWNDPQEDTEPMRMAAVRMP